MANLIAVMYKLDYRGRIVDETVCYYYSHQWQTLVSLGWITHTTEDIAR